MLLLANLAVASVVTWEQNASCVSVVRKDLQSHRYEIAQFWHEPLVGKELAHFSHRVRDQLGPGRDRRVYAPYLTSREMVVVNLRTRSLRRKARIVSVQNRNSQVVSASIVVGYSRRILELEILKPALHKTRLGSAHKPRSSGNALVR